MIHRFDQAERSRDAVFRVLRIPACLMLWMGFSMGLMAENTSVATSSIHVTYILGCGGIPNNTSGSLSIKEGVVQFQGGSGQSAQVIISAIQKISLGEQDKQVGGTTMAVTRAAAPFGGGRVIGLFSHKKYDTLTVEYLDADGGFHGAILQLNKGQGRALSDQLSAGGVRVTSQQDQTTKRAAQEATNDNK
jgi:hypothetical protein